MADLSDKGSESSSESQMKRSKNRNHDSPASLSSPSSSDNLFKRTCVDCGTSKTPLWRGGPGGPKSLCNACGIRNRKRRRALLALNKTVETKTKSSSNHNNKINNNNNNSISGTDNKFNDSLKRRLFKLGKEFMLQKANADKQRFKLGEVEQAAVLLMALSYGSVSA